MELSFSSAFLRASLVWSCKLQMVLYRSRRCVGGQGVMHKAFSFSSCARRNFVYNPKSIPDFYSYRLLRPDTDVDVAKQPCRGKDTEDSERDGDWLGEACREGVVVGYLCCD